MTSLLQGITFLAAAVILTRSIIFVNNMTRQTDHWVRVAYWLIVISSFAEMSMMLNGHTVSLMEGAFIVGFGLLFLVERRRVFKCPFDSSTGGNVGGENG